MNDVATIERDELDVATQQEARVPATTEAAAIMQVIERAAVNPQVDIDKMERLFAMHERMKQREVERAFADAMAAAQEEMPVVIKNKVNSQTHSKYADLAAISAAITPVIAKHGFSLSFGTDASRLENHYCVTCTVSHEAGHSKHFQADVPIDAVGMKGNANKTATHAFGSTMSYGRRYLTLLIFNVATGDDDDGNAAGGAETMSEDQVSKLRELIEATGADEQKFLAIGGFDRLEDIPADQFKGAVDTINARWGRDAG